MLILKIFFVTLLTFIAILTVLFWRSWQKIKKRRPKNIYPKPPNEPDPGGGQVFHIDYNNGYPLKSPRKIRVLFVTYRSKTTPFLIRAYCLYATRQRWFKINKITKVYDETGTPLVDNAQTIFKDKERFSRTGWNLPPHKRE